MLRKEFDGYLEFMKKLQEADKEETEKLATERVQLWTNKLQKILGVMPEGDIVFAVAALYVITDGIEKENPKAADIAKTIVDSLEYETKSGTIDVATEAAARAYYEAKI